MQLCLIIEYDVVLSYYCILLRVSPVRTPEPENMPELPEVETVKRGLEPVMNGAVITKLHLARKNLRFPFPDGFAQKVEGKTIIALGRRAKYLLADLSDGEVIIMHLGMSGSFRIEAEEKNRLNDVFYHPRYENGKHDHVVFELETENGLNRVIYNDPRRFGFMDMVNRNEIETCSHFAKMGIEPTGNALDSETLCSLLSGKSISLKAALLNQHLIAGLGNIYVCEALWRAGLSPKRKASTITAKKKPTTERADRLAYNIREVISAAIEAGGSSLKDHRQTDGSLGYFQHSFNVYDRQGKACRSEKCSGEIVRIVQSGRSTFYCPSCQK